MKGTITTYLPEKHYGFIKGDDGKDYFFHENEFRDPTHIGRLCEDAWIDFDQQATPKGYRAKNCSLLDPQAVLTYTLPTEFIKSRTATVRGWEVIEYADWIVHGASRDSPDAAQQDVVHHAKLVGANALVGLEYYKTTGSESGSGRGTHHFTIHNFRGQLATFAKRTSKGAYRRDQLLGLNGRAESLKKELVAQTNASKRKQTLLWAAVLVVSIISALLAPVFVIAWVVLGFIFGRAKNYDDWLERV